MSTMYSRSVAMLRQEKNAILSVSEDDAFLDVACFETQQAVEFLIKAILLEKVKAKVIIEKPQGGEICSVVFLGAPCGACF